MQQLIDEILRMKAGGAFTTYIDYIRFPRFRNLEKDCKIDFDFPLTALVGQNGSGKSSTLQALFGAPGGNSVGTYWFSTEVDPIKDLEDGKRNCMIYAYTKSTGDQVEVLKTRIQKTTNPDYWEPSRPLKKLGMRTLRGAARHPTINMEVVHIDFRSILSAFDKYFYFRKPINLTSKTKQEYLRKKSKNLHNVLEDGIIQRSGGTDQNKVPVQLTDAELGQISEILGKKYVKGTLVDHKFFQEWGTSVFYRTDNLQYSEAFAGSGEIAVVELVHRIYLAPNHSLVLLDEPDVSLHPGAQEMLKIFLLDQIKRKKLQIVISTHSPALISGLPPEAIKVFISGSDSKVRVIPNRKPEEAFFFVGQPNESLKTIIVEDTLAKDIIEAVLNDMGEVEEVASQFDVKHYPGGADIICRDVAVYSRDESSKVFIVFDGDRKLVDAVDEGTIPENDRTPENLLDVIKAQAGCEVIFYPDGGDAGAVIAQKKQMMLDYLRYWRSNVRFISESNPEKMLWSDSYARTQFEGQGISQTVIDANLTELIALETFKDKFVVFARQYYGDSNPKYIKQAHALFLAYWRKQKSSDSYQKTKDLLEGLRAM